MSLRGFPTVTRTVSLPYAAPVRTTYLPPAPQFYGSIRAEEKQDEQPDPKWVGHYPLKEKGGRARIDFCQVLICALVPFAVFALTMGVLSSRIHFLAWPLAWIIALFVLVVAMTGFLWLCVRPSNDSLDGKWMKYLYCSVILAWFLALILGDINYTTNMKPFYDMSGLNYAPSVNPSLSSQSYIDVGRMLFLPGSHIQTNMSMGVRIGKTYCVAPVVTPSVPLSRRQYDFWVVGVDCCSSIQPQDTWRCPGIGNSMAHGGLRLMSDESRPFFRMAVQEAEATYKMRATHPIFLHWMQDPTQEMTSWRDNGMRMYYASIFSVLILMCFVSITTALFFARYFATESHRCEGTGFGKYAIENPEHVDEILEKEGLEQVKNIIL